ncbi:DUF1516 family protein, partial [Clostridium botulinum]|uniref:DUF1516 family protein n=1 Tax=Clostridium botulinum TaxID=1491 RepID=UPI00217D0BD2
GVTFILVSLGGIFMVWLWTYLVTWIVMAIMILLALFTNKNTKIYEMITRVGYLIIIATGIKLAIRAWSVEPTLLIVKIIVALIFIALVEIAFARKEQKTINESLIWAVIIFCIVTALIGFALAGWYPFV